MAQSRCFSFTPSDGSSSSLEAERSASSLNNNRRCLSIVDGLEPRTIGIIGQNFGVAPALILQDQGTTDWKFYHVLGKALVLAFVLPR